MNILFFLTPKADCTHLYDDESIREALERMELAGYTALPIIKKDGTYCGTLTEGDLLWSLKNLCKMDIKEAELHNIMEIAHHKDNVPVSVSTDMSDLLSKATEQNFVPVVDDRGNFIGIITRKSIMQYFMEGATPTKSAPHIQPVSVRM